MIFFRKKGIGFLFVVALLIHAISYFPFFVDAVYSNRIYPVAASVGRFFTGWVPFSMGDVIYPMVIILIIYHIIRYFRAKEKRNQLLLRSLVFLLLLYIVFNLFWGLNYNRVSLSNRLHLNDITYNVQDLDTLNCLLVQKINKSRSKITYTRKEYPHAKLIFEGVKSAYKNAADVYPFLTYRHSSIKPSLWGWLGNYAGFTGYYNPFTAEAQVNTTIPAFLLPYTACHEVAHQLGFAGEMEANVVGYLAARSSTDPFFHYSVYLDLFNYANRSLYLADSMKAKSYRNALTVEATNDINEWIAFNRKHSSFVEPVFIWVYDKFLKSNNQPTGIYSYDEVTRFLIAYRRKYGAI